jgi:hypothetical protein
MVFKKESMKILLLSFFLLPFSLLFSQGNLQFNQVLTYSGNSPSSPIYTVPIGKVWKVESAVCFNYTGTTVFKVNNYTVLYNNSNVQPIWLKAGDFCQMGATNTASSYFISIVEFNIIP